MHCYDPVGLYLQYADKLHDPDTDQQEILAILDAMATTEEAVKDLVSTAVRMAKNAEREAAAIKEEQDQLSTKKQAAANRAQWWRAKAKEAMEKTGLQKVEDGVFRVSIRNNAPSVEVYNAGNIPTDYLIPQDPKIDRDKLLKDLKDGVAITGAALSYSKSLMVR